MDAVTITGCSVATGYSLTAFVKSIVDYSEISNHFYNSTVQICKLNTDDLFSSLSDVPNLYPNYIAGIATTIGFGLLMYLSRRS